MGHHGTIVRVDTQWASNPPDVGSSLVLEAPKACAHPVACLVEGITGSIVTLRAMVSTSVSFEPGSVVGLLKDMRPIGTGKVA